MTSAELQRHLEKSLHSALDGRESLEYSLSWKHWDMPSGPRILARRASALRTSDKDSGGSPPLDGWPKTPQASDGQGGVMEIRPGTTGKYKLRDYAQLAGWATATATDGTNGGPNQDSNKKHPTRLSPQAALTGWMTPKAMDGVFSTPRTSGRPPEKSTHLQTRAMFTVPHGPTTELFHVPTGKRVVLAPEFSLWLMGFPEEWVSAAPGAKDWQEAQAALVMECSKAQETP